jgi:hypothetical protein
MWRSFREKGDGWGYLEICAGYTGKQIDRNENCGYKKNMRKET